jgi:hypothetical protein
MRISPAEIKRSYGNIGAKRWGITTPAWFP